MDEFYRVLSSISIPITSTNAYELLTQIQPGLSTLSTSFGDGIRIPLTSTVIGLGSSGYVSTSYLQNVVNELSYTYKYISATTLYDCFANLANMQIIGNELGPMILGSNLNGGYVSTVNPGEYRIYKSSIPLDGGNLVQTNITNNDNLASALIDIGGFQSHIRNTSKMILDIQVNMNYNFWNGLQEVSYVSTVLVNAATNVPIGEPHLIDIEPYTSNSFIGSVKFMFSSNDLTPYPTSLRLRHAQSNQYNDICELTTIIPKKGGIFITLDNTD